MPWYQTAGILIAAVFALLNIPKLVFETCEAAPLLRRRMLSRSMAAEKATAPEAKEILTRHAAVLENRLAAAHEIRYSRRDMWMIASAGIAVPILWGSALFIWPLELAATAVISVMSTLLSLAVQPRLQTVQANRKLFAALECPKQLQRLAIPSYRDYMFNTTTTPRLVLETAEMIESKSSPSRLKDNQAVYVNRAIALLEGRYRHQVRPR